MSLAVKNRIRTEASDMNSSTKQNSEANDFKNVVVKNNRILSPYSYIKYYNKVVENMDPIRNTLLTSEEQTNFKFIPLNKINIPFYLEKDHNRRQEQKKQADDQRVLTLSEKQALNEELLLQKRTEELLNKIAENNKKLEEVVFRTHSIIPKIIKNADQISFIDQTQKKYFSITRQIMDEINKHRGTQNKGSPKQKPKDRPHYKEYEHVDHIQIRSKSFDENERYASSESSGEIHNPNKEKQFYKKQFPQIQKILLASKLQRQCSLESGSNKLSRSNSFQKGGVGGNGESIQPSQQSSQQYIKGSVNSQVDSANGSQNLIMRNQLRPNISVAVSTELKLQKQQDIISQKQILQHKFQKKMDHISKNKNPNLYMNRCILDRKNITLRKILSSIPQTKLKQIYIKKKENFFNTLEAAQKKISNFTKPLKKYIKPTFSHLAVQPDFLNKHTSLTNSQDIGRRTFTERSNSEVQQNLQQYSQVRRNSLSSFQSTRGQRKLSNAVSINLTKSVENLNQCTTQKGVVNSLEANQQKKFLKLDLKKINTSKNNFKNGIGKNVDQNKLELFPGNFHSHRKQDTEGSVRSRTQTTFYTKHDSFIVNNNKQNTAQKEKEKIQIIDQNNGHPEQNQEEFRKINKQPSQSEQFAKEDVVKNCSQIMRIKDKREVQSIILQKSYQKNKQDSSRGLDYGSFTTFYSTQNTFQSKKKFKIKDKLEQAFNEFKNKNYFTPSLQRSRSRQDSQTSNKSSGSKMEKFFQFGGTDTIEESANKTSIFDSKKYFNQKYSSSTGVNMKLSQSLDEQNQLFEQGLQKIIQNIAFKDKPQTKLSIDNHA